MEMNYLKVELILQTPVDLLNKSISNQQGSHLFFSTGKMQNMGILLQHIDL